MATGTQEMETLIVSDPEYFRTSYGRVDLRVRARKKDDTLCGDGNGTTDDDEVCHSEWSGWYSVRFTPQVTIDEPDLADTSIMELRENVNEAIESGLGAAGASVNASVALQFVSVLVATALGAVSIAVTWRVGMAPLGVGMAFAIVILVLFNSHRLRLEPRRGRSGAFNALRPGREA